MLTSTHRLNLHISRRVGFIVFFILLASALTFSSPAFTVFAAADSNGNTTINILYSSDMHSRVYPDKNNTGMIGLDKVATYKKSIPNALLVDAGDTIHGLPLANLSKGENIIELMALAGYDVMVPGNHDFNYGEATLLDFASRYKNKFDIISANVVYKVGKSTFLKGTTIREIGGVKVGFFGLTTTSTSTSSNPTNIPNLRFDEYEKIALESADKLRSQGAQVVVCIAHVGRSETKALADSFVGKVDLVIDAHDHITTQEKISGIPYTSTGEYGENLGKAVVTLNSSGKVSDIQTSLVPASDFTKVTPDKTVKSRADQMTSQIESKLSEKIGTSNANLSSERGSASTSGAVTPGVRNSETALGNLVADAMQAGYKEADFAFINGGDLRADIKKGNLTKGDVNSLLPFGNFCVVKYITPFTLRSALEVGVAQYPEQFGGFPQVSSGLSFKFNPKNPAGIRITEISINGKKLDLNDTTTRYKFVTNEFLANGGDGYNILAGLESVQTLNTADVLFENYIKNLPSSTIPESAEKLQNRIVLTDDSLSKLPFTDIENHWAKPYIIFTVERGLFNGVTESLFMPDSPMTKAMFTTVLYRYSGDSSVNANPFTDVKPGVWYEKSASWAAANGIVDTKDGLFSPGAKITPLDTLTLIYLYYNENADITKLTETEVIEWAISKNIIDNNNVSPTHGTTRAEGATILTRFLNIAA